MQGCQACALERRFGSPLHCPGCRRLLAAANGDSLSPHRETRPATFLTGLCDGHGYARAIQIQLQPAAAAPLLEKLELFRNKIQLWLHGAMHVYLSGETEVLVLITFDVAADAADLEKEKVISRAWNRLSYLFAAPPNVLGSGPILWCASTPQGSCTHTGHNTATLSLFLSLPGAVPSRSFGEDPGRHAPARIRVEVRAYLLTVTRPLNPVHTVFDSYLLNIWTRAFDVLWMFYG